ncbi:MAG: PrsW family glutamic-type intramembrane protease [Candidatus Kariarchaeaceae archaeon]
MQGNYGLENEFEPRLAHTQTSYFPVSRIQLLMATGLLFVLFWLLYGIGEISSSSSFLSDFKVPSRFIFALLGPLISFSIYLCIAIFIFYEETKELEFPIILQYSIVAGIVGILFALTINSRGLLLAILFILEYDQVVGELFAIAIVAPVVEETAKALPIFYISKSLVTDRGRINERRLVQNIRVTVFIGIITGTMFNLLETYWYTWNVGYIFFLDEQQYWQLISFQIVLRALNPLHILAASISGFGIGYALWNTNRKVILLNDYRAALPSFFAAMALHALWNGSALLFADSSYVIYMFGDYLPIFNVILLIFSLIGLPIFWWRIYLFQTSTCNFCGEWHKPPYDANAHLKIPVTRPSFFFRLQSILQRRNRTYSCPNCRKKLMGLKCENCDSTKVFTCSNCGSPIPVYQETCWKCEVHIRPVFDNVMEFEPDFITTFSRSFTYILAGFYIPSALSYLILMSREVNSADEPDSTLDIMAIQFLFLLLLGLSMIMTIKWFHNEQTQALGLSLSRMITGMVLLQFAILMLFVGFFLWILAVVAQFWIAGLLFILEGIIIIIYSIEVIFGFQPVFHLHTPGVG